MTDKFLIGKITHDSLPSDYRDLPYITESVKFGMKKQLKWRQLFKVFTKIDLP